MLSPPDWMLEGLGITIGLFLLCAVGCAVMAYKHR